MDKRVENELLKRVLLDIIDHGEYLPPTMEEFSNLQSIHNLVKYNVRPLKKMCTDALNFIDQDLVNEQP